MSYFRSHRFRIVEFNVENLFIFLDHFDGHKAGQNLNSISEIEWQRLSASTIENKPVQQVRQLASAIEDLDPDILLLCEVGGKESLANFNRYFLDDRYIPYLIEGNSDRGIDIGYLVHRRLPFRFDLISHKHRPLDFLYPHERQAVLTGYDEIPSIKTTSHRFSRDVVELRVYDGGAPDGAPATKDPAVIFMLVHLKSQLDRDRIDPGGRDRRRAELEKLVKIYNEINQEFGERVPIILGGDFNGSLAVRNVDAEFAALYRQTKLQDALEIAQVADDNRFTYLQLYQNRPSVARQLDYIFLPPELAPRVNAKETFIFRFKDQFGMPQIVPKNLNEKRLLPSDHYPVILTLNPESS